MVYVTVGTSYRWYNLPLPVPFLPRTLGVLAADGCRCRALRRADVLILIGFVNFIWSDSQPTNQPRRRIGQSRADTEGPDMDRRRWARDRRTHLNGYRQTGTDRWTQTDGQTNRQIDRQTSRQTDKRTERQTNRQADSHTWYKKSHRRTDPDRQQETDG